MPENRQKNEFQAKFVEKRTNMQIKNYIKIIPKRISPVYGQSEHRGGGRGGKCNQIEILVRKIILCTKLFIVLYKLCHVVRFTFTIARIAAKYNNGAYV